MQCTFHPGVEATGTCADCGRPFCVNCLVDFMQLRLCGPCRDARLARVQGAPSAPPPTMADHIIPARNPQALTAYYLGIFGLIPCVGLILGPAAIVLGVLGLKARKRDPNLPGAAHAITGIVIGTIDTLLYWGLVLFV